MRRVVHPPSINIHFLHRWCTTVTHHLDLEENLQVVKILERRCIFIEGMQWLQMAHHLFGAIDFCNYLQHLHASFKWSLSVQGHLDPFWTSTYPNLSACFFLKSTCTWGQVTIYNLNLPIWKHPTLCFLFSVPARILPPIAPSSSLTTHCDTLLRAFLKSQLYCIPWFPSSIQQKTQLQMLGIWNKQKTNPSTSPRWWIKRIFHKTVLLRLSPIILVICEDKWTDDILDRNPSDK